MDPDQSRLTAEERGGDRRRLAAATLAFGISLGTTAVAFPLLALEAGFSASVVGLLAALSAAIQMVAKMSLTTLLARVTDRSLMVFALVVMLASAGTLIFTTAGFAFVTAQVLQGIARGIFWTSSQTHGVRSPGVATRQLAYIQTVGQLGQLIGPAVAGTLAAISLFASLWAGVAAAGVGVLFAVTMYRLPPYEREPKETRTPIWRHNGVGLGSWAGATAGAWRGILDSFVPVILDGAGLGARTIGWLMSTADGASLASTASVARWGREGAGRYIPAAAALLGLGLILLPMTDSTISIAVILIMAGVGGGLNGILGTAAINEAVEQSEQGAAIALVGVYRAGARSATPAFISAILQVTGIQAALAVAGIAVTAPVIWIRRARSAVVDERPVPGR